LQTSVGVCGATPLTVLCLKKIWEFKDSLEKINKSTVRNPVLFCFGAVK